MKDLKEGVFSFIWAAICAWITVWVLVYLNSKLGYIDDFCFPAIVNFFHGHGFGVRKVFFFVFFLVYWLTGIHKLFGNILLMLIGWGALIFIVVLVVFLGFHFLRWIAGTV
ncbi:MAG: hypothetical protein J6C85_00275 [Alphaproteobacteria bacterium]|nr:hypothetical protein [Alphaproteobacteria bacterium]